MRPCSEKRRAAFTLIEVLLVLIIIGLLAGLVAPRLFGMKDKADRDAARGQISLLYSACDNFRLSMNTYPSNLAELIDGSAMGTRWAGPYLESKQLPKDPWGYDYVYEPQGSGMRPRIYSVGPDGQAGTADDIHEDTAT